MCVSLCVARATELLGCRPEKITALLSANILKNAMGVGIPGTGMIGLPIAIALGAIIGKSEYQLEVIKDLTPDSLEEGKQYIDADHISIQLKSGITEKLYVEITCEADGHKATAVIATSHTHFVYLEKDGEVLLDERHHKAGEAENNDIRLNMRLVYDFAMTTPEDDLRFILKTRDYNFRIAEESKKHNYGHCLGKTIDRPLSHGIFGNSIFSHIISKTASACDARMGGAMIPVMSNSGSGNQGICATNPVAVYAEENENTEEELIRALTLSHLTAIYIKLNGKLIGSAQRVPVPTGSTTILVAVVKGKDVTKESINAAMKAATSESFGYNEDQIVSSDVIGMRYGSLFDATQTMVAKIDDDTYQVQVVSWYDNENSYTSQMVRTIKYFAENC